MEAGVDEEPVADSEVVHGAQQVISVVLREETGVENDDHRTDENHHHQHEGLPQDTDREVNTSLSVCQVARATGEAKCHGSKLHKEVTEIKVYWFVCLNTFKFAKSKNGLFET